ncbi:MAG: hypothetical protein ACFFD5_16520 [Candidatus Thorarchaeota archaeon]
MKDDKELEEEAKRYGWTVEYLKQLLAKEERIKKVFANLDAKELEEEAKRYGWTVEYLKELIIKKELGLDFYEDLRKRDVLSKAIGYYDWGKSFTEEEEEVNQTMREYIRKHEIEEIESLTYKEIKARQNKPYNLIFDEITKYLAKFTFKPTNRWDRQKRRFFLRLIADVLHIIKFQQHVPKDNHLKISTEFNLGFWDYFKRFKGIEYPNRYLPDYINKLKEIDVEREFIYDLSNTTLKDMTDTIISDLDNHILPFLERFSTPRDIFEELQNKNQVMSMNIALALKLREKKYAIWWIRALYGNPKSSLSKLSHDIISFLENDDFTSAIEVFKELLEAYYVTGPEYKPEIDYEKFLEFNKDDV